MHKILYCLLTAILGLAGVSSLTSCYDDKGNYNYIDLDEVVIDTTGCGIQSAYSVGRYDHLTLEPNILLNGQRVNDDESAPLDYMWTLYTAAMTTSGTLVLDTLGFAPALDADITTVAGTYRLQLTVTQRDTGVQTYLQLSCQVEESITAGWMLLYERADQPGTSDVGLVVNTLVKKNITAAQEREFWNLYSASNQEPIAGTPVRIFRMVNDMGGGTDPVTCLTTEDLVNVNNATFEKTADFADFFYAAPAVKAPIWYGTSGRSARRCFLINDNAVYTVNYMYNTGGGNYLGNALTADFGELAAWGSDVSNSCEAVVFDQTNGRFYHLVQYTSQITPFEAQSPTAGFDVNNVNATIQASDWGRSDGNAGSAYDYLLMRNGNNRYLAIANFNGNAADTNVGIGWYDITNSPGIQDATSITAAFLGEYVLYGSGNKVYNLQYNSSPIATEAWTAPSAEEEVTCVRLQKFYYSVMMLAGILPNPNTVVHIATWNESTREGKLYQYTIDPATGAISGEPRIYTVPGKVGDMNWKYVMEM
ncbi:MAG TPA: hypothetical protein DCZ73_02740 [Bacteroides sp.]|nr:hypothetical protein [Bacteroides sp.]